MHTLCLDFGNSRFKAAVFNNDQFIETIDLLDDTISHLKTIIDAYKPEKSILSSVVHHDADIESLLIQHTKFHKISNETILNFKLATGKPETTGVDRLALAAAAVHLFPKKNNLIISVGTCITYNFINSNHQFLGGAISPGMDMRFKSMHEYTAKLPLVTQTWNIPLIGYDTKTNLQSGVIVGIANEIEGFIEKYNEKFGNFNVLLTGGNSVYFVSQLKNKIFADINFLFKGLYALSELNNLSD